MSVPPVSPGSFAERWTPSRRGRYRHRGELSVGLSPARSVVARHPEQWSGRARHLEQWSALRSIEEVPHRRIGAPDERKAGARVGAPGTVVVRGPRVGVAAASDSYQI